MRLGTILLLLLLVAIAGACARTTPNTQTDNTPINTETAETIPLGDVTLVLDDQNLQMELTSDPLEDIGTLDEMPIDDSIPE